MEENNLLTGGVEGGPAAKVKCNFTIESSIQLDAAYNSVSHLSFSGKLWNFLECEQEALDYNKQKTNLSDLNTKILMNRGIKTLGEIECVLDSKLKNTIPDPSLFLDMDKAVSRITQAITNNEKVLVFGDYDVDGITSTYILVKYLKLLGAAPECQLPNRFTDGYGLSDSVIENAISKCYELIIVVDSGINAVSQVAKANEFGIDVVILDHHIQAVYELPKASAIVNPNRLDQADLGSSCIKNLCAAGVVFMFLIALQRELKKMKFFEKIPEPNLHDFINVVTLGTLCDVMEIRGVNRAFVKFTLEKAKYATGITALMYALDMEKITCADDFSFFLGPAINAAGRVGDPMLALKLFLEEDLKSARAIATKLVDINKERKSIEKQLLAEAFFMIESLSLHSNNGICVFGDDWHEGVVGIIAGKIKDRFQKPTFVISFNENGVGKGSARSVEGAHLGEIFEKAKLESVIIDGGGHSMAGGFSIHKDSIEKFNFFLNDNIRKDFVNYLHIDYTLSHKSDLNKIAKEISVLEPFGKGLEKPTFCLKRLRIKSMKKTSNNAHLMIFFSGEFDGNIKAIIFNISSKNFLLTELEKNKHDLFDIAAFVKGSEQFGGSLIVEDIRHSNSY